MALLKKKVFRKFRASSLIENLVASVLIVIVFMIASLSINNVFGNYIQGDEHEIKQRFSELSYFYINKTHFNIYIKKKKVFKKHF